MKVSELIKYLSNFDPNSEVHLQVDSEGNGYNSVYSINKAYLTKDYEYFFDDWGAEGACMTEEAWDELKKNAIVVTVIQP